MKPGKPPEALIGHATNLTCHTVGAPLPACRMEAGAPLSWSSLAFRSSIGRGTRVARVFSASPWGLVVVYTVGGCYLFGMGGLGGVFIQLL